MGMPTEEGGGGRMEGSPKTDVWFQQKIIKQGGLACVNVATLCFIINIHELASVDNWWGGIVDSYTRCQMELSLHRTT